MHEWVTTSDIVPLREIVVREAAVWFPLGILTCSRDQTNESGVRDGSADTKHLSKDPGGDLNPVSLSLTNPPPQLKLSLEPACAVTHNTIIILMEKIKEASN